MTDPVSTHTATPWRSDGPYCFDAKGNCIVNCDTDNAVKEQFNANAAFIVRACNNFDGLLAEHTNACDAADTILALMTMYFGRLMVEGPDEEITVTMCGHSVSMPAHYFNRLYNATTRIAIAKATTTEAP